MGYRRLSLSDEELLQQYRTGISTYRLARLHQCHHTTIRARLLKRGEPLRTVVSKLEGVSRAELEQLVYRERLSDGQIADKYGVSATSVRNLRLRYGVASPRTKMRSKGYVDRL